jgi:hypothetical protein
MRFKTVCFSESVESVNEIGLKRWKKYEAEVELSEGDDEDVAAELAKEKVRQWLRDEQPKTNGYNFPGFSSAMEARTKPIQEQEPKVFINANVPIEEYISSCNNIEELEKVWFRAIDKKPEGEEKRKLWLAYDAKFDELKKQTA